MPFVPSGRKTFDDLCTKLWQKRPRFAFLHPIQKWQA
jgi:hypothetical protein